MSSTWQREQDTEDMIRSGRVALNELHRAAGRLNAFVTQLEQLVAEERKRRAQATMEEPGA